MSNIQKSWNCPRCGGLHGTTCEMSMLHEKIKDLEEWTIHAEENIYKRLKALEEKVSDE